MAVAVKYTGGAKTKEQREDSRPTVTYVGGSTISREQSVTTPETTVSTPSGTAQKKEKKSKTVNTKGGTFLGGFSYKGVKRKEKTEEEKAEAARQQAEYLKEYQRLLSLDTDELEQQVSAAKTAAAENRPKYQVHALGGSDPTQQTEEQKAYSALLSDLNKAKSAQYDVKGAEALENLSADESAAVETLATERKDSAKRQAAWSALQQAGYSDSQISELVNYQRNIPKRQKNAENYAEMQGAAEAYAETNPGLATLGSVPANLVSGIGTVDAAMKKISDPDSPTDYKSAAMLPYAWASTARGTVSEELEKKGGKTASFLYGVGTSILDNAATTALAAVGIPATLATATLGGAAATDAMVQAQARGLSDEQAIVTGVAAGVFETLFEKVSLEKLLSTSIPTGTVKNRIIGTLKNTLVQAGVEGSEELATSFANLVFDWNANGQLADVQQRMYSYMAGGMDYDEAKSTVTREVIGDMALDFAAGALAGGLMGGGKTALETAYHARVDNAYGAARQQAREKAHIRGEYTADESGKTTRNGQEVSIEGVDAEGKYLLNDGTAAEGSEIRFADQKTAEVYEGLSGSEVIPTAARNAIAKAYEGKQESDAYVLGAEEAYRAGSMGMPMEGMSRNSFNADLTDAQRKLAYDLGKAMRQEQKTEKAALKGGGIVYEKGVNAKKLTRDQKTSVKVAEVLSNAIGGKVHLYSSTQNGEGVRVADQQSIRDMIGEGRAPNGFYDHKTGDIYIDVNAGSNGEGTILYTLSHEYTHLLRQNARESFDKLAEQLFRLYSENGEDVDALILAKQEKLGVDYDTAYEEFVADSMEAMLTDTDAAEKIAELKKTNKTAWEKLRDLVRKLLDSVWSIYKKLEPNSREGQQVREMGDALQQLSDLFAEGLAKVGGETNTAQETVAQQQTDSKPKRTALDKLLAKAKNGRIDPQTAMDEMGGKKFSKALDSGLYGQDADGMLYRIDLEEHIDQRHSGDVGDRKLKAFQFDHPELHQYFAQAAGDLMDDFNRTERGGEIYKKLGVPGVSDDVYLRTKRLATKRVARLLDEEGLSYDDIERALTAIMEDNGQENFAAAKRVELMLDEMLTKGYRTSYGQVFEPNEAYIRAKQEIPGAVIQQKSEPDDLLFQARTDKNGKPYVMVENAMTNAQLKDRQAVADYIAQHIGEVYTIIESGQRVYIGEDLPKEYTRSKYSQSILKTSKSKAKNKAVSNLGEMVEIATNRRWEKTKHTHNKDAAYGMYRYDTTFAFQVQGNPQAYKAYDAELVIRNASDGKKYLYDIVDIKENTGLALDLNQKADRRNKSATQSDASANSISTSSENVNRKISKQERYQPEDYTEAEKKQHVADAKSFFGKTYKWSETGYVTVDGTKLDFSGRHEGGSGGYRTVDHRDIRDALGADYGGEDYSGAMVQFMSEGNIRISPESGGINLSVMPTKAQLDTLSDFISKERGEVILDIDDTGGNTVSSTEYPRGTHSSKVINDIKAYFENGTVPQISELAQFRYQERGLSNREILASALESATQTPREREVLAEYKDAIGRVEGYEARLKENRARLKELTLTDEKKNAKQISKLKVEISQDEKRINTVGDQMAKLEEMDSLKNLIGREKEAILAQQQEQIQRLHERLEEYRSKYGVFPGGEKAAREILLPKKSSEQEKISQTVRTILEASATPDAAVPTIEEMALDGKFSYETYSDKSAIADAEQEIKRVGWAQSLNDWRNAVSNGSVSKKNTAMGWALYNNAANCGDTETAISILSHMVEHQRNAAQALQATRILKTLSPETQLYQAQRSVENLQTELNKKFGDGKAPELKIDTELAEQFMTAENQEERDAVLRSIYRDIGKQMPSRFIDKWNAWRYLAMLGNARTHVRNVVGNAGFVPVVAAKNTVATGIENAVYRLSGGKTDRTKAFVSGKDGKALLKAAAQDYAKIQDVAMGGGKYSDFANANQYIEEGRVIFQSKIPGLKQAGKVLEKARKANSKTLDQEDVWFSKPHYAYAMAQYCKANGITAEEINSGSGDNIAKAREYAIREAQKATYRDTNTFSQAISELGRSVKTGNNGTRKVISTVMEGILPFRKTPANILVRGIEYSPIGLMNGIKQAAVDVRKGTKTSAEAIDTISAGLTGTGLVCLGVYLAAQGLVRGHGDDDKKKNDYAELGGHQAYALELPDGTSITLDWLAPECLPFFIGVNLWEVTDGGTEVLTMADALNAISQVSEPLLEMSCLQSLNEVFDAVGYAKDNDMPGMMKALASAGTSYLTQALPTLLGQAERSGESIRYTTYTEKDSALTSDMQYTLGKASARIPGVDYQQIPYIDAWGRTESSGSPGERIFNNFLNPAYVSQVNESAMEKELLRLYEATGEGGVLPARADKSITVDGTKINLTGEQYVKFAKKKGGEAYKWLQTLTKSSAYQQLNDAEKVDCVQYIYQAAAEVAKGEIVSGYEKKDWVADALSGSGVVDTAIIKAKYSNVTKTALAAYKEYGSSIGETVFFEAWDVMDDMVGEDYDGDGRSDPYSKIDKKLDYIDSLSLSADQKRALAIAGGISEKNIDKRAPWN